MELYSHNKITYDKAVIALKESNKVCIVQATGTGKSFITMKLFQDYYKDNTKLYIVPRNSIADSIRMYADWSDSNVSFMTYTKLSRLTRDELNAIVETTDILLLDEMHRAGAKTWLNNVKYLMINMKVSIGLTATPKRSLDRMRDMAIELFKENIVYGPNVSEAVRDAILPEFTYIALLSDVREFIAKSESSVNINDIQTRNKIERLRIAVESENELSVRIKKYRNMSIKKWIIFCTSIEQLNTVDNSIQEWFAPESIKIFKLKSSMGVVKARKELIDFNNYTGLSIICCVDMLNEGAHVEGVAGLFMCRKTNSLNVFTQQLGRALSASNKSIKPQIFDIMNNYENMKQIDSAVSNLLYPKDTKNKGSYVSGNELIINDAITLSAMEVLEGIKKFREERIWTISEDYLLENLYPMYGTESYKYMEDIDKRDCCRRARQLGLKYRNRWSLEEDNLIRKYYPKLGKKCAKYITNRSEEACVARASLLNVKQLPSWSVEKDIILILYYGIEGEDCFKRISEYTVEECRSRVKKLRL